MTLLPSDSGYEAENEVSWNAGAWLGPACIVLPSNAADMSTIVKTLVDCGTHFAIRGGGHMPVENAANINSTGVLISSTNLKTMQLSDDMSTLAVGPGFRWGDAYSYLNSTGTGKMVSGGRYTPVGIPGYLIGGGMSFFSYEKGFSSANGNIEAYECVLADGTIVNATATENDDLYWALRGGGNSFCLITTFTLKTFDSPGIGIANPSYGGGAVVKDQWLNAILDFTVNNTDNKAAIIPVARQSTDAPEISYDSTLFHNSIGNPMPGGPLAGWQGAILPAIADPQAGTNLSSITMAIWAAGIAPAFVKGGVSNGLHQRFHVAPTVATRQAMDIVHDTIFDAVAAANLVALQNFTMGLAWNAITPSFLAASNAGIGCPQGVSEDPQFWVEESYSWGNAADSPTIDAFIATVNANMTAQLEAAGATIPYLYLNDADQTQDVFSGYPAANVERLKTIRDKYDPGMVFTNLMPGGQKVALSSGGF